MQVEITKTQENREIVPAWQLLTVIVNEWVNPQAQMSGFATIQDAEDGSGDGILTFPDGFCEKLGWKEGDQLELELLDDKSFTLTKKQQ
jgi:hypothetical protein